MGILGFQKLQTDEVAGGATKLQMIEKIVEWKTTHPEQQPIVVIRLKELMMAVIQLNVKAAFFGGSHRYYHEELEKFFQQFRDLNVKLVFFCGGTKTKDKLNKMTLKVDQDCKKYSQLLKHIDKTKEVKLCSRPELRSCLGLYEEGIARKYGEYCLSTGSLNKDIVQYSRENENVVAILAKDSDFLLYDLGSVEYWSCGIEHLNFNGMTTFTFNRQAMLEHLKLSPYQYHVMVAIAGVILNDIQKHAFRVSKGIMNQITPGSAYIIRSISDAVRDKVPETEDKPNFGAWTTFMFTSHLEEYCWLIEKQYKKYEICTAPVPDALPVVHDGTDLSKKYKNIWSIINDEVIRIDFSFIDISRWNNNRNAMPFQNLFVLVFKRAMGIVLHSKKDEAPVRRFLIKGYEFERCKILTKPLVYSSIDVPTIENLIDETSDADEEFITKKWSLLFWILHLDSFDDDVKLKIRSLQRDIVPVVITVLFLLREHQITPMEADTIIISEKRILDQPPGTDKPDYPTKADGRTIRVAHIYVHTRVLINRCFQICGIDLFNIPVSFDGVQLHNLMDEFVEDADKFRDKKAEIEGYEVDAF